jgi:LCP family protein required for cell wall assembly
MSTDSNQQLGNLKDEMADTAPSRLGQPPGAPPAQPSEQSMEEYQPIHVGAGRQIPDIRKGEHRRVRRGRWAILAVLLLYFFAPLRTNILILGADDSATRGPVGRSDTLILSSVSPYYTGLLGIPRDLWVSVPGVGEQRINTAYFFAEAQQRGSGARAAMDTVRQDFGVAVHNYVVLHMGGLAEIVDALGGVDVSLDKPMAGYPPGTYHLDGTQALAFIRERYTSDDFSRMKQGQVLIAAGLKKGLNPANWQYLPATLIATSQAVDTNIPIWLYPRLGLALVRTAIFGMDGRTITREMVFPFQTDQGAQVLAPNWEAINPVLKEMFGQ